MIRRIQIAFVSLVVGLAAATGGLAMARAVGPSAKADAAKAPGAAIAKRQNALDRMALALRKARAQQPPKLPKVPHFAPVKMPSSSPSSASSDTWSSASSGAQAQQPVTYRRSKPVVRYVRPQPTQTQLSHRGDDEAEEEDDGEHEDEHEQDHEVEHEHDDGGHEGH